MNVVWSFVHASESQQLLQVGRPMTREATGQDVRCGCGNLLARLVPGGVELKCRRCKRAVVVPLDEGVRRNPADAR